MYSLFRYTGCYIVVHRLPVTICTHRSYTLDVTKSSTDCLWRYVLTVPIHWMLHSRPQIACDYMYSPFRYTVCYKVVHRLPGPAAAKILTWNKQYQISWYMLKYTGLIKQYHLLWYMLKYTGLIKQYQLSWYMHL